MKQVQTAFDERWWAAVLHALRLAALCVAFVLPSAAKASLCPNIERELADMALGGPSQMQGQAQAERRAHLEALLFAHQCQRSRRAQPRSQPLTAGFYDLSNDVPPGRLEVRPSMPIDPQPAPRIISRIRSGALVCVRLCDGFFFPLGQRISADSDITPDELCQRRCPSAETRAFSKPGDLENAVSSDGRRYASLPNAFRYRRSFDATCSCGEGAANNAPLVLNPMPEESPPSLRGGNQASQKRDSSVFGLGGPSAPPPADPEADPAKPVLPQDHGDKRAFHDPRNGVSRTVRVIAPELSRDPSEAKDLLAPARAPAR